MKNKEKFEFPWHYLIIGLLLWFLLYIFFDIPNRFAYQNKGWDIPAEPREKAAYDHAHNIKLPKKVPDGGFVYYKVNESYDTARAAGTKSNPALFKTVLKSFPEPQPFSFSWARFKSFFGVDRPVRDQYFNHLCATESGEYIYKTVNEVDGLYQMRPMPKRTEALMFDRYGFEDPANWTAGEGRTAPRSFITPPFNKFKARKFSFFESMQSPSDMSFNKKWVVEGDVSQSEFWHYTSFKLPRPPYAINDRHALKAVPIDKPTAKYAYTWRGIKRTLDRRYGLAGGELIVLNRETNEILGFRRAFAASRPLKGYPRASAWEHAVICPRTTAADGLPMPNIIKIGYSYHFINQIFEPLFEGYQRYHFKYIGEENYVK